MTLDELDALHAAADPGPWKLDRQRTYARAAGPGEWVTRPIAVDYSNGPRAALPNLYAIVALKNNWPAFSARLRAAEAEVERLRGALRAMVDTYPTAALVTPSRFSNAVDAARAALGKP